MEKIKCPRCKSEFNTEIWKGGECPKCKLEFHWEEVGEDMNGLLIWEEITKEEVKMEKEKPSNGWIPIGKAQKAQMDEPDALIRLFKKVLLENFIEIATLRGRSPTKEPNIVLLIKDPGRSRGFAGFYWGRPGEPLPANATIIKEVNLDTGEIKKLP